MFPMHRSHGLQHLRHKRPTFAFVGESGYTRHPSPEPRTQRLTRRNRWRFGWGWYHYPRSVPHVSETLRGRGLKRQTLPLLGLGRGCSQRTQRAFGTAMRLCASLSRGVAAPLGCVILFLLSKLWLVCHALRVFPRVRDMGGITTLGVLCVLLKRWTAACQIGYPAILFVPRKSSEINPNSPPILIVPFPTFPGKAIHSGSQSEAGHRSLLMLFLVILRLVDIFPTI